MYAVIQTGGKQYRVSQGDVIHIEKLDVQEDNTVNFDVLMLSTDEGVSIGTPVLTSAKVEGKVLKQGRGEKVIIYKYKSKKGYRRKKGHRQPFTRVEITSILA